MKKPFLVSCLLAFSVALAPAQDLPKLEKLTLKSGREYLAVTITQKRPDGISISHESGTARVKFEDLPDALATQLGGFDPAAAVKARAKADASEAAALAEIDRGLGVQQAARQTGKDHKALVASAQDAILDIIQATEDGVLCRIAWGVDVKAEKTHKDAFGRNVTTYKTEKGVTDFSEDFHFVTGVSNAVDGQQVAALLVGAGKHRYTQISGASSTVRKWNAIAVTGGAK